MHKIDSDGIDGMNETAGEISIPQIGYIDGSYETRGIFLLSLGQFGILLIGFGILFIN